MSIIDIMADAGPVHDDRNNPFGLVYEYPITENVPGQVNIHPVTYPLRGLTIAANVYTPADYDPNGSFPAITVAHPNGGTKEQTAGRYAQRLAEQGYLTIAADAAYQGHSEGEPRSVDKPFFRTDDVHGMADFIATFPASTRPGSARWASAVAAATRSTQPSPTSGSLFLLPGAQRIQTYWVDEYVDAALGKLTAFFGRTV